VLRTSHSPLSYRKEGIDSGGAAAYNNSAQQGDKEMPVVRFTVNGQRTTVKDKICDSHEAVKELDRFEQHWRRLNYANVLVNRPHRKQLTVLDFENNDLVWEVL
jgi:hypothetical protein